MNGPGSGGFHFVRFNDCCPLFLPKVSFVKQPPHFKSVENLKASRTGRYDMPNYNRNSGSQKARACGSQAERSETGRRGKHQLWTKGSFTNISESIVLHKKRVLEMPSSARRYRSIGEDWIAM